MVFSIRKIWRVIEMPDSEHGDRLDDTVRRILDALAQDGRTTTATSEGETVDVSAANPRHRTRRSGAERAVRRRPAQVGFERANLTRSDRYLCEGFASDRETLARGGRSVGGAMDVVRGPRGETTAGSGRP
jgi:DNA-binding Lrp family transcriptional regulator